MIRTQFRLRKISPGMTRHIVFSRGFDGLGLQLQKGIDKCIDILSQCNIGSAFPIQERSSGTRVRLLRSFVEKGTNSLQVDAHWRTPVDMTPVN